ncbi:MAG: tRNA-uridine aminocarboxypropyltransferase [Candidatus Tectimicrobiota bacterium]
MPQISPEPPPESAARPPLARGYNVPRCATCGLPPAGCICALTPHLASTAQFWILIHPDEQRKPTNTARLIAAALPQSRLFPWYRTAPPAALLELLGDPQFAPYLLHPQGDTALLGALQERPWLPQRVPAFLLLDGTWSQASKMLNKSPYLHGLPRLALLPRTPSRYLLRRQRHCTHLSTVEVAIALLAELEPPPCSELLQAYFHVFTAHCLAARHGHGVRPPLPDLARLLAYKQATQERDAYGTPPHPG